MAKYKLLKSLDHENDEKSIIVKNHSVIPYGYNELAVYEEECIAPLRDYKKTCKANRVSPLTATNSSLPDYLKSKTVIIENFLSDDLYKVLYKNLTQDFHIIDDISELDNQLDLSTRPYLLYHPPIARGRQRRSVGFVSNTSEGYRYSGQIIASQPMTFELQHILEIVNRELETNFNGILINYYESGDDYISAHSDDERGLDRKANEVASLSFGFSRTFRIRDKKTKQIVHDFILDNNMLFVMKYDFQKKYTHEIPKERQINRKTNYEFPSPLSDKIVGGRISLTFRSHIA